MASWFATAFALLVLAAGFFCLFLGIDWMVDDEGDPLRQFVGAFMAVGSILILMATIGK